MIELLKKLIEALQTLLGIYRKMSLSEFARTKLGTDFTDDTVCPDDVSCSYAVTTILREYFQLRGKKFPIILGTDLLDDELSESPYFKKIFNLPEGSKLPPNTVIVSPRTPTVHGHTGIPDIDGIVMNNSSSSGLWVKSYDRYKWRETFVVGRGLVTHLYEIII